MGAVDAVTQVPRSAEQSLLTTGSKRYAHCNWQMASKSLAKVNHAFRNFLLS